MKEKKVAFVASIYFHFVAFHRPIMKLLQEKGYVVYAYAHTDVAKSSLEEMGVICRDISIERSPTKVGNAQALAQLVKEFRKERFKLVHLHTPTAGIIGRVAARRAKVPSVIYTAHGFHFYKGSSVRSWLVYYPIEKLMARFVDYLITINEEDYEAAKNFPVRKEVVLVPGVGVDSSPFDMNEAAKIRNSIRVSLGVNENDILILSVGELNGNKNHIQLILAMEQVVNKHKQGVYCFIVGKGELQEELEGIIQERELSSFVRLLGFRGDVPNLMIGSDVVVNTSKREGLPKTLMEAMAASKAIVATDIRGNRDLVIDDESGVLVAVGDVQATSRAIDDLINNKDKRFTQGAKGKERLARFELCEVVEKMESVYDGALQEGRPTLRHVRSAKRI